MITPDVTSDEVRKIFKRKKVLIIGDSICRGIYKDLCCLLSGNNRLLSIDELRFNRRINNKRLFDHEIIECCTIDRTNSINNVEKRRFSSAEHDYHLDYWFCSRVWNRSMNNSLSYIEQYNFIFMQSMIWDLSRYNDRHGKFYLENLAVCLSNMKKVNKNITWIIIPPSDSYDNLNKLILQMHLRILEMLKFYDCASLDLYHLKDHLNIRSTDGIHFTPTGHRFISSHLIKLMSSLHERQNITECDVQSSSNNDLVENQNITESNIQQSSFNNHLVDNQNIEPLEIHNPSHINKHFSRRRSTKRNRVQIRNDKAFQCSNQDRMFHHQKYTSHFNKNCSNIHNKYNYERENSLKRMKTDQEAEQFGRAFGIAWSTYQRF